MNYVCHMSSWPKVERYELYTALVTCKRSSTLIDYAESLKLISCVVFLFCKSAPSYTKRTSTFLQSTKNTYMNSFKARLFA